jgi:asparagine synthase (glutamine-hydrolysing)
MCGIAGLVLGSSIHLDRQWFQTLSQSLKHRGPDDVGLLYLRGGKIDIQRESPETFIAEVVLLHRRLAILDLSKTGWQPMGTPDGQYYIVFNGEIYNYLELRNELKALGHHIRSQSDTEVLLAGYTQWGVQVLNRLVGMFALAILDLHRRTLFLARDFFGIKPLYYANWRDGVAFASEITPLLELSGISRQVNPQRLYDYLRFGMTDHGGETLLTDIQQLPAAHYMEIALDNPLAVQPVRYWEIDLHQRIALSFNEAADYLRELFLENIRLHLRSDVPVGAALSGGIDSSSIVMAMRYLEPDLDIHAFSYIADKHSLSEEPWIDLIGQVANVILHKVNPRPNELAIDLNRLVEIQEECFGGPSVYAQYRVFERAHEIGIKVMLDGQGADELLGGYHYYIAARLASLLYKKQWAEAIRLLYKAAKLPGLGLGPLWLQAMDFFVPASLQEPLRRCVHKDLMPTWLNRTWFRERAVIPKPLSSRRGREILRGALYHTFVTSSLPHLLRYEDRNSMAFSVESRVPFLTPNIVAFMFAVPEDYLIASDGTTKAIFRKAMRGIVPDAILERKDKIGFATPEMHWLTTLRPWVESLLTSETARKIGPIDFQEIQLEWAKILRECKQFDSRVWRWLNLIAWTQKFGIVI